MVTYLMSLVIKKLVIKHNYEISYLGTGSFSTSACVTALTDVPVVVGVLAVAAFPAVQASQLSKASVQMLTSKML